MPRPANASRAAAMQSGAKRYEGRPCRKGHSGTRYTSTAACVQCAARPKRFADLIG